MVVCEVWFDLIIYLVVYMVVVKVEFEFELVCCINIDVFVFLVQEVVWLGVVLIYFFIDYVFDGQYFGVYMEDMLIYLLNVYGVSKCDGELVIVVSGVVYWILWISWVYNCMGNNFMKMVICLVQQKESYIIVGDQFGVLIWVFIIVVVCCCMLVGIDGGCEKVVVISGIYYFIVQGVMLWYGYV